MVSKNRQSMRIHEMGSNNLDENNDIQPRRSASEPRLSPFNSTRNSDDHASPMMLDDEYEIPPPPPPPLQGMKSIPKPRQLSQIPKFRSSKPLTSPMIIVDNKTPPVTSNTPSKTPRQVPVIPPITRRPVQGILVRFFRNGDAHHVGVKVALNELEIKSWETFLNYLNRQPNLVLPSGGIKFVYGLNGHEIRSLNKFQNRQSYVVASGIFAKTTYRHANDSYTEEPATVVNPPQNQPNNGNMRSSGMKRWRSPPSNGDQLFILPYSRLNLYESILLNRSATTLFDQWLNDEVTDLLSQYTNGNAIKHLYAVTKTVFTEVTSFSYLFNTLKVTDTFIACTEEEFQHSKRYLATMKPDDFFSNSLLPRKPAVGTQRYVAKQVAVDAKLSLNWIHGYDGTKDQTKNLYSLSENEILYVIGSVCIVYDSEMKQQRFYTKHTAPITCVNTHRHHTIVASSETTSSKDRARVSIHIWDYSTLDTLHELRREQFSSDTTLLSFSPKPDDNLLLVVSRDKPKVLLFVDWKRNEVIYSITNNSDKILSAYFVFDTIQWIACISQQHLRFYHINWTAKPLRIAIQRESEVQNIYTGAAAYDHSGELLIVGDKVGSIHIWSLLDNDPKLIVVKESILENDVHIIVSINQDLFLLANGHHQIKFWNVTSNAFEETRLKDSFGLIQSVCCTQRGLAIGTRSNFILMKEVDNEQIDVIMRGHTSPAICICCNPNTNDFFSLSTDRHLFKWNNKTRSVEWAIKPAQLISCAALHPERNIIALGTETSKLLIYDTLSSFYITTITLKVNTGVKSVRFSPDGGDLAIGLQNGTVCIFNVLGNGDFQLRTNGTPQSNNAPVSDLIWSVDSSYLLAVYTDHNYNIWTIPSFDNITGQNIQNISWHQAVHPVACSMLDKATIETQTSAIVLSPNLVLCCGKDGQIRLFQDFYERSSQILPFELGSTQTMISSTNNNTYLLAVNNIPAIVEVQVNVRSQ